MMRAPNDKLAASESLLERACREAGAVPKSLKALRASAEQRIARLLRCDEVSRADLRTVADYLRGRFDRKREDGRVPDDIWQRLANDNLVHIVRQIKREEHCTYREAVAQTLVIAGIDDPAAAKSLLKRVTR